jgi:hypothetical protein
MAANLTADPGVAASARSLTHPEVRSRSCSAAPSARLASFADSLFDVHPEVFGRDRVPDRS